MNAVVPSSFYNRSRNGVVAAALCLIALNGCAPPRAMPSAAVSLRAVHPAATTVLPAAAAISRVHSLPLYQQAEQACKAKRYAHAADLLQRLVQQRGLNEEEVAFVQQQRNICLYDAGLPVPTLQRASLSSPIALPPARRSPASPADVDCGPRALLLDCRQMGVQSSLEALRKAAGTSGEGTSLAGLAKAAKAVGLQAEGVQVSRDALPDVDMPAIAYVNGNHFVAILAVQGRGENGTATIHDPNEAREETVSQERLLRLCSGYLLLLHK